MEATGKIIENKLLNDAYPTVLVYWHNFHRSSCVVPVVVHVKVGVVAIAAT